jgi:hypothetical protein
MIFWFKNLLCAKGLIKYNKVWDNCNDYLCANYTSKVVCYEETT